jgi:hypothetical protein
MPSCRARSKRACTAQLKAGLAVNRERALLYWRIGREILLRQKREGWGAKVIDHLARDLGREFPEMHGFSPRNLKYMRSFAEAWPEEAIVQQVAAQLPWFHNCVLLDKVRDPETRLTRSLPSELKPSLPTVAQLEAELASRRPGRSWPPDRFHFPIAVALSFPLSSLNLPSNEPADVHPEDTWHKYPIVHPVRHPTGHSTGRSTGHSNRPSKRPMNGRPIGQPKVRPIGRSIVPRIG